MVAPLVKARSLTIRGRDEEQTKIWVGGSESEVRISTLSYRALLMILIHLPERAVSTVMTQPDAATDTLVLIPPPRHGVARTWRKQRDPPWRYSKAGVVTTDLVPLAASQRALIGCLDRERAMRLMGALDACNARWGRSSVVPARTGLERHRRVWATKFELRTPAYTTRLNDLPTAHSRLKVR